MSPPGPEKSKDPMQETRNGRPRIENFARRCRDRQPKHVGYLTRSRGGEVVRQHACDLYRFTHQRSGRKPRLTCGRDCCRLKERMSGNGMGIDNAACLVDKYL